MKTLIMAVAACLFATPIFAQTEDADTTLALKAARAECAEYQGDFSIDPSAIIRMDITGDGVVETIVDERFGACSTLAAFRSGTGGWVLNIVKSGVLQTVQMLEWSVIDWRPTSDDLPQKVLLLARHGSFCGMAGSSPCFQAVVWSEEDAKFVSTIPLE